MNLIYNFNAVIPAKDQFDKAVSQVLKRPEYRNLSRNYMDINERIRNSIQNWLNRWFEKIFNESDRINSSTFGLSNGIVIIGAIVLVFIVILLFLSMRKTVEKNNDVSIIFGEEINRMTTPEGLRDKAKEYKTVGNFRDAIRLEFISILLKMSEKNILYLDDTKTNREITELLINTGFEYTGLFQELVHLFNEVWFGHKEINEDEYNSWERKMNELWDGVLHIENKK